MRSWALSRASTGPRSGWRRSESYEKRRASPRAAAPAPRKACRARAARTRGAPSPSTPPPPLRHRPPTPAAIRLDRALPASPGVFDRYRYRQRARGRAGARRILGRVSALGRGRTSRRPNGLPWTRRGRQQPWAHGRRVAVAVVATPPTEQEVCPRGEAMHAARQRVQQLQQQHRSRSGGSTCFLRI